MELFSDQKTSVEILRNISENNDHFFILESVSSQGMWSRYVFLGYDPKMIIEYQNGTVVSTEGTSVKIENPDPTEALRSILSEYKSLRIKDLPPFTGGLVGFFSYNFVGHCVPGLKLKPRGDGSFPDLSLMLIDRVIAFDHFKQKIFIIVNVSADNLESSYIKGIAALKDMEQTYRILRATSPSPYMVYLKMKDMEIACASPETLVTLRDGMLSAFPLVGIRDGPSSIPDDRERFSEYHRRGNSPAAFENREQTS